MFSNLQPLVAANSLCHANAMCFIYLFGSLQKLLMGPKGL